MELLGDLVRQRDESDALAVGQAEHRQRRGRCGLLHRLGQSRAALGGADLEIDGALVVPGEAARPAFTTANTSWVGCSSGEPKWQADGR